jgi:A/G-specific adenine glycosylase
VIEEFSKKLIEWYNQNKRDLPWRGTKNPYKIWLSEIILQQTRVAQGTKYYLNYINKFPTINLLANAIEDEVLKLWQGLGYYSRARNLHFTAKVIQKDFNGKFPNKYEDIIKLKGIGDYTAAAISSFAYNLPYPVVDGNVYRVLSRIFGIENPIDIASSKKIFLELANSLIDKKNPAQYNQAIMEFGALQCTPVNPNCEICIFKFNCFAKSKNKVKNLPIKAKKLKQRIRHFNYLHVKEGAKTIVIKRNEKDIWHGLYEFPLFETDKNVEWDYLIENLKIFNFSEKMKLHGVSRTFKHQLTHQTLFVKFWQVEAVFSKNKLDKKFIIIKSVDLEKYPVPRLIEIYLQS